MVTLIHEVSGFDFDKADELRKVMGRKQANQLELLKLEFLGVSAGRGFGTDIAEDMWWFLLSASAHLPLRENIHARLFG